MISDQSKSYLRELLRLGINHKQSCGYQKITLSGTLTNLTIPENASYAVMTLESVDTGVAARYLEIKSPAVTASIGMPLYNGTVFSVSDYKNLEQFQVIRAQAGATSLNIQYYK